MTSKSNSSKNSYLISGSLLTFLSIFPFIVVWLLTPQDKVFVGGLVNIDDLSVYLSAIRQGAEGNWLFNYQFTSEPITPKYTYIIYIFAEHLMRIVGGTSLIWFHTLRLLSGITTLRMGYKFIQKIFPNNPQTRHSAWLLCCFGSGIGWLLVTVTPLNSSVLTDLNTPEWSIISAWLSAPHFILGIGLEPYLYHLAVNIKDGVITSIKIIKGFLATILLSSTYAFHIIITGVIIGIFFIIEAVKSKSIPWKKWNTAIISSSG